MGRKVYINGELVDQEDARISVLDHGVLYGDGVFEGIRVYAGKIFRCGEHIKRLYDSAKVICLEIPMAPDEFCAEMARTVEANGIEEGYIRAIVTRGAGTLGLNPFECTNPAVVIIADAIALYPREFYEKGLSVITVPTVRNLNEAVSPRVKSLNYLNNILAKIEALNAGCEEAIMLNGSGFVAECSGDNIFVVRDGAIVTPPATEGVLRGITRGVVMELAAAAGGDAREERLSRYDLFTADECFLTGTAAEVVAIVNIDGRTIGDGEPGPVTQDLARRFHELVRS